LRVAEPVESEIGDQRHRQRQPAEIEAADDSYAQGIAQAGSFQRRMRLTGFRLDNTWGKGSPPTLLRRGRRPLKAPGLTSEIIAWRLRLFVPADEDRGPAILAAILERRPLVFSTA
jgi:hypothetical protein